MHNIISVVIPTYNRSAKLKNALDSVLQETRVPIRLFVFDNCSQDDTEQLVADYIDKDDRIVYHRHESNTGPINNYVFAFNSVQTEYFLALSDDDWICPDFLYKAYHALEANTSLGAAVFLAQAINEKGEGLHTYPMTPELVPEGIVSLPERVRTWFLNGHFQWSSTVWRKAVKDYIQYPYWHTGMPSDVDFQLQAFMQFPVQVFKELGSYYFVHSGQFSQHYTQAGLLDWVKLYQRADQKVLQDRLFNLAEYQFLRGMSVKRYRENWIRTGNTPLSDPQQLGTAFAAGIHLGDWETGMSMFENFLLRHGIDVNQIMTEAEANLCQILWGEQAGTLASIRVARQQLIGASREIQYYKTTIANALQVLQK